MGRPGQLCARETVQHQGLVAPGEGMWPESEVLAEKEVGYERLLWVPLLLHPKVGPARTPPLSSL